MIEIETLLAEATDNPPCGPDLEHDPAYLELENAVRGKPQQQFGETVIPAEEPDWGDIRTVATVLLQRSKDLRIATLLTRALVNTEGFAGLLPGIQITQQLLDRYWDDVYPQLDPDDDNDPTMRLNALVPLVHAEALIQDLRKTWLVRSRQHGQVLVRDVEVALGRLPPRKDEEPPSVSQIEGVLAACAAENAAVLTAVSDTLAAVKMLSATLSERVGANEAPDFKPLQAILASVNQVCEPLLTTMQADGLVAVGAEDGGASAAVDRAPPPAGATVLRGASGEILSRRDATMAIEKIIKYLEQNEPTNPAQLLLKRAKRWMSMNFVDIIRDMAPDSLSTIEMITGRDDQEAS